MHGRNGEADVENRLVDTSEEGKARRKMRKYYSHDICTISYVKQITSEKLLYNTGSPAWSSVMIQRGRLGLGREAQEGGDICIPMADSRCCTAQTNTTL